MTNCVSRRRHSEQEILAVRYNIGKHERRLLGPVAVALTSPSVQIYLGLLSHGRLLRAAEQLNIVSDL